MNNDEAISKNKFRIFNSAYKRMDLRMIDRSSDRFTKYTLIKPRNPFTFIISNPKFRMPIDRVKYPPYHWVKLLLVKPQQSCVMLNAEF